MRIYDATVKIDSAVADFTAVNVRLEEAGSVFELGNDLTIGHLVGADLGSVAAGRVVLNGHTLKIASGNYHYNEHYLTDSSTIPTVITGSGSVVFSGGTVMTNLFAHTFTGAIRLLNADVATVLDAAFPAANALAIDNSGWLALGGSQAVSALSGGGVTGGIAIPSGKKLSVTGAASGTKTYSARLSGAGDFEKNGGDTLVLSGVNSLTGKQL